MILVRLELVLVGVDRRNVVFLVDIHVHVHVDHHLVLVVDIDVDRGQPLGRIDGLFLVVLVEVLVEFGLVEFLLFLSSSSSSTSSTSATTSLRAFGLVSSAGSGLARRLFNTASESNVVPQLGHTIGVRRKS